MNCLKVTNAELLHKVLVVHTNQSVVADKEHFFRIALIYELRNYDLFIKRFEFTEKSDDVYDMFRELLYAYGKDVGNELNELAKSIVHIIVDKELSECNDSYSKDNTFEFIIKYRDGNKQKCSLCFNYNSKKHLFLYKKVTFYLI